MKTSKNSAFLLGVTLFFVSGSVHAETGRLNVYTRVLLDAQRKPEQRLLAVQKLRMVEPLVDTVEKVCGLLEKEQTPAQLRLELLRLLRHWAGKSPETASWRNSTRPRAVLEKILSSNEIRLAKHYRYVSEKSGTRTVRYLAYIKTIPNNDTINIDGSPVPSIRVRDYVRDFSGRKIRWNAFKHRNRPYIQEREAVYRRVKKEDGWQDLELQLRCEALSTLAVLKIRDEKAIELATAALGRIASHRQRLATELAQRKEKLAPSAAETLRKYPQRFVEYIGDCFPHGRKANADLVRIVKSGRLPSPNGSYGKVDTATRIAAIAALGKLQVNDVAVKELLIEIADFDDNETMRRAAGQALKQIESGRASPFASDRR